MRDWHLQHLQHLQHLPSNYYCNFRLQQAVLVVTYWYDRVLAIILHAGHFFSS